MQISSNINSNLPVNTVKPSSDRVVRDDAGQRNAVSGVEAPVAAIGEFDLEAEFNRRVDLSRAIAESRNSVDENLPRSTQQALQAFESNNPTAEQQLGIELAGVDTYA